MLHKITLAGYEAHLETGSACGGALSLGTAGSYGVEQLLITAADGWQGLRIRASFQPAGVRMILSPGQAVDVPWEATQAPLPYPKGRIVFQGFAEGKLVTTCDLPYSVAAHSAAGEQAPQPPTPDEYEQFVQQVQADADRAEAAANQADKAAGNAKASETSAAASAQAAKASEAAAAASAGSAKTSEDAAAASARDAQSSAGAAQTAQNEAEHSRSEAAQSAANAAASAQEASSHAAAAEQSQQAAASSATQAEQAAQRAEDAAAAANTLINDTAIAGSKTWSSLRILDTLCPPIQATGNPVVCHPVEGYPLGVTVDFAPIQEGEGDPSPENIRPIKARESVEVVRCGINMVALPDVTADSYNYKIALSQSELAAFNLLPRNVPMYFFVARFQGEENPGRTPELVAIGANGDILGYIRDNGSGQLKKGRINRVNIAGGINSAGERKYSGLCISPIKTESVPYTGQTTTLTLPAPCYGSKLDAVTGEGQETWKLLTLDGTEDWTARNTIDTTKHRFFIKILDRTSVSSTILKADIVSNRYKTIPANLTYRNVNGISADPGNSKIVDIYDDDYSERTLDEWKSYLAAQYAAGTPVQIAYKVATPTPITATGGKPIPALAGTNTLLTDGDTLTVTGREDIVHTLAEMSRSVTQNTQVVDAMLGIAPEDTATKPSEIRE